ncbi:phosphopyruvate hydratase [Hydrogenophaga crassostreae]|uniref:Enolase n=1 Tax=Hydrogenophaga crassostreae TaxID=1763535 RepID=A0A162Z843_9BURK|nr:phosphopyruvate hydratase [Hydrogenophaga crassostreae]AOW13784.1 phosphopyruvate hydratase [Hydrogenophaga crassostreae]OAD44252.1 phosphopyruvate hydratase [Hydrogenophaga crassostreae]
MNTQISAVRARQILDSRGRPTVEADVTLADGSFGRASVPSGASTGSAEAHELRDGDATTYAGLGVLKAVAHANSEIAAALAGLDAREQHKVDLAMRSLDGTPQLARLGANAVLAVSIAVARAAAASLRQPLFERVREIAGLSGLSMPVPMVNILSGGLHAGRGMDVQDFLAMPVRATSIADAIHIISRVRNAATEEARARGLPTLLADEGGVSPGLPSGRDALEMMLRITERAGLKPGDDVVIAIDVAAASLQQPDGSYALTREGRTANAVEMTEMLAGWVRDYPVVSIEDGLGEEDWSAWAELTQQVGHRTQLVGDDLFTTHPDRLARGVRERVANGVLVKANQNGTLSGTIDLIAQAKAAGYATIVSARSGETEDAFMSDLAVGSGAGQIKIGSLRTSSTVAKYNQLLRIEEACSAPYAGISALVGRP